MRIKAWIVAIEEYGAGLAISAPVGKRAMQLAELLAGQGVEPSDIVVNVSPAAYHAALKPYSDHIAGAAQGELRDAMTKAAGGDVLLVYWIGHGVKDSKEHLVLCADSTRESLRTLAIDDVMTRLRGKEYALKQMGFFDCCAQIVSSGGDTLAMSGVKEVKKEQYCFFAASSGELAAATLKESGFTGSILSALGANFPPQPNKLYATLQETFKRLRDSGDLETRPVAVEWSSDPGAGKWSHLSGGSTTPAWVVDEAARAGVPIEEFLHLQRFAVKCPSLRDGRAAGALKIAKNLTEEALASSLLSQAIKEQAMESLLTTVGEEDGGTAGADLLQKAWRHVSTAREFRPFSLALGLFWNEWLGVAEQTRQLGMLGALPDVQNLTELHLHLLDQHSAADYIRLLEMAGRKAQQNRPKAYAALTARITGHGELGTLYAEAIKDIPKQRMHVMIGLGYDKNAQRAVVTDAWWWWSGVDKASSTREVPAGTSPAAQVQTLIQEALSQAPDDFVVELLAPNDLLCVPRETLCLEDDDFGSSWLEEDHPVVVRWHPRLKGDDDRYEPGTWKTLSKQVQAAVKEKAVCEWHDATQMPTPGVAYQMSGLRYGLQSERVRFLNSVRRGGPYMCWPRSCDAAAALCDEARELMQGHCVPDLPGALQRRRRTLAEIILLIDEPERNPYTASKFQNTPQRGEKA